MIKFSYHDKHYKVILFQAAVLTLLFHIAMFYAFVYKAPPNNCVQHIGRQIVMFNPTSNDIVQSQAMTKWLAYHNPSLIAHPDYVNGYGAASARPKIRPPIKTDNITITAPPPAIMSPKKFKFLSGRNTPKVDNSSRLVGYNTLALPPPPSKVTQLEPKTTYPLVKSSNGQLLNGVLTNADIQQHKLSTAKVRGITRLQLFIPNATLMPSITIKNSCGVAALDRLAVRNLLLNHAKLAAIKKTNNILFINIIWREVKP